MNVHKAVLTNDHFQQCVVSLSVSMLSCIVSTALLLLMACQAGRPEMDFLSIL